MCGIAGLIHRGKSANIGEELTAMLQSLRHRGPDSTGFALYGNPMPSKFVMRFKVAEQEDVSRGFDIIHQMKERKVDGRRSHDAEMGAKIESEEQVTDYAHRYIFTFDGDSEAPRRLHRGRRRARRSSRWATRSSSSRIWAMPDPRLHPVRARHLRGHPRHRAHADGDRVRRRHPVRASVLGISVQRRRRWSTTASSPTTGASAGISSGAATGSCPTAIPS